jgi:hypothetical protein
MYYYSYIYIQNRTFDKDVDRMENLKDISEKEEWASKAGLLIMFLMN